MDTNKLLLVMQVVQTVQPANSGVSWTLGIPIEAVQERRVLSGCGTFRVAFPSAKLHVKWLEKGTDSRWRLNMRRAAER